MNIQWKTMGLSLAMAAALAGCGGEEMATEDEAAAGAQGAGGEQGEGQAATPQATAAQESAARQCAPDGALTYICGLMNPEDLLALGDTGLILVSGMSTAESSGHMYLIDPSDDSYRELIYGGGFTRALDQAAYPDCPGPLPDMAFSIHGLALDEYENGRFDVYATSHGEREAIEIFDLDLSGADPALTWEGCVVLPQNTFANSVAILDDGGFVTTKMMDPRDGFAPINAGEISGLVYEWHPGDNVMAVAGTELSGANGIALSEDDRYMYVAAFGTREIVRFDRGMDPIGKEAVAVDIVPDNVRWGTEAGMLLTAGGNAPPEGCAGPGCQTGWSVVAVDADTLETTTVGGFDQNVAIQGVSSALRVGDRYWVGTFNGNRVAHFPADAQ